MSFKKAFLATIFITFLINTKGLLANEVDSILDQVEKKKSRADLFSRNNSEYDDYLYTYGKENAPEEEILNVKTLLEDSSVNNIDPLTKDELIKKEIQKLNHELDELNEKLRLLNKENKQLKDQIESYNNEYSLKEAQQNLIEDLKKEARAYKVNLDLVNIPDKYIAALDLLLIGDTDLAQKQFIDFINFYSKNKKNKEYLNSTSGDHVNVFIAYSYYWLGKINNINRNYKTAVENFSFAYKLTDFNLLSLISLIGLIESLTNLSKSTEACVAIKQFMQDYEKALKTKSFNFDQSYLKLVENYKSINKCQ